MLQGNQTAVVPICGRCKLPITDVCYVEVCAAMVVQQYFDKTPQIFYNKESAENYAQRIPMHPVCWINTLKDHGAKLHNMKEILSTMKATKVSKKPKQKQRKKRSK